MLNGVGPSPAAVASTLNCVPLSPEGAITSSNSWVTARPAFLRFKQAQTLTSSTQAGALLVFAIIKGVYSLYFVDVKHVLSHGACRGSVAGHLRCETRRDMRDDGLPGLLAHADWSAAPEKRWLALATPVRGRRYRARLPEPVGRLDDLFARLMAAAGDRSVLLGVDFPIGLPAAYAKRAGIADFVDALRQFGSGRWREFYEVAGTPEQIALTRPFYPARAARKGETSRAALIAGLGLAGADDLFRRCDLATGVRPRAAALFWTLGAQQVGKAAIAGWRGLLAPALNDGADLGIWPFDGPLERLLAERRLVVAETYPREAMARLGLRPGPGGKRSRAARLACADRLRVLADELELDLDPGLDAAIADGFGERGDGEDRFDALIGLLGVASVACGPVPSGEPREATITRIEGWILGQQAAARA